MNTKKPTRENIWSFKQNKPSLIAEDLFEAHDVPHEDTHEILLKRGVYKWLAVRRDLIKLKNKWRDELTELYRAIERGEIKRNSREHLEAKGRIKTLEECRAQVRALCHSERWRAPDFDSGAVKFLESMEDAEAIEATLMRHAFLHAVYVEGGNAKEDQ